MDRSRRILILIFLLINGFAILSAQEGAGKLWLGNTAFTIPRGEVECGLFQNLRTGLSPGLEISTHPLLFFVDPNAGLKIRLYNTENLVISSEHNVYYPTPMLKLFQMKGAGGIISSQYSIPFLLSFYNGVLISKNFNNKTILTGEIGLYLTAGASKLDKTSSIDLPVFYPRLGSLYHQPEFLAGLIDNSVLINHFNGIVKAEVYMIPGQGENLFFEQSGMIQWIPGTRFMLQAGYKLCYGRYPFGSQWSLLPDFDFVFHFPPKAPH